MSDEAVGNNYPMSPAADWSFQDWLTILQTLISIIQQLFPPAPFGGTLAAVRADAVKGRNPIQEEKVRLIIISACQLWMLLAADPTTKAKLMNVVMTCADPVKWETIANLFWGP